MSRMLFNEFWIPIDPSLANRDGDFQSILIGFITLRIAIFAVIEKIVELSSQLSTWQLWRVFATVHWWVISYFYAKQQKLDSD